MQKTIQLCDMCGQKPGDGVPKEEGVVVVMGPAWIHLNKITIGEGDLIAPRNYSLCSEKCLQDLVAGKPPLGESEVTVTSAISQPAA